MQDQTSLTLCCCSFLGGDSDLRTTVYAHNGGHCTGYAIKSLHSTWINQEARPIIIGAPLTLIFKK
jgi:hypothetical protein